MIIYTDRYSTNPTIQGKRLIIKSKILSTKGLFKYRVSKFGLHPDPPLPLVRESDILANPLYPLFDCMILVERAILASSWTPLAPVSESELLGYPPRLIALCLNNP